jgi:cyclopropane-fatty-acyl-phospholipid synthase
VSYDFPERFDRVVSVEMFEHLRNYDRAMAKVSSWLNPGGKLFVHVFAHLRHAYAFDGDNWLARHFFTGGVMPSDSLLLYFQNGIRIAQHWVVAGTHYQKTSEAWLERLDRHRERALALLASSGVEDPLGRFWMWRLFFLTCAESFGLRSGTEWAVSHYLFGKS